MNEYIVICTGLARVNLNNILFKCFTKPERVEACSTQCQIYFFWIHSLYWYSAINNVLITEMTNVQLTRDFASHIQTFTHL